MRVCSRRAALRGAAAAIGLAAGVRAQAQAFPARPLKLVVPFAAGGLTDALARAVGERLVPLLGQQVLVDNRPGAAGHIAAEAVARGPADGYQLVMLGSGHAGGAIYNAEMVHYDLVRDFTALGMLGFSPSLLIARKGLGIHSFAELVAAARAKPGELSFAAVQTYTGEYLESLADIQLNIVLYRGAAQAMSDVLGGRIDVMVGTLSDMQQVLASGKFDPVALNSPKRVPQLPGVASVAETIPGYRGGQWYGLFVPVRTAAPVVARLRADLARSVQDPAYVAALQRLAMLGPDRDVDAFAAEVVATLESFRQAKQTSRRAAVSTPK